MRLGNQQISAAYLGSAQLTEIYLGASPVLGAGGAPADTTPPVFTSGDTATPIAENSGAGQTVYTAAATDASLPVTYSLKATGDHAAFAINGSTGAVTLTANPDYESKSSYSFTVIATDAAGNASEQAVALAITDVDEAAPTLVSAAVNGTSLVLTYSESLATPGPAASAFSVSGATTAAQTPSSAVVSGATVTLTLPTTAAYGQTITVSYAVPGTNPIRDAAGNNAAALTAQAVTNNTASVFAPIYASGVQGVYIPSITQAFTSGALAQDASGATPVTAVGQPIGLVLDASGRGNNVSQATATARPLLADDGLRKYMQLDGVDDSLTSPAFTLAAAGFYAAAIRFSATQANYAGPLRFTRDGATVDDPDGSRLEMYTDNVSSRRRLAARRRYPTSSVIIDRNDAIPAGDIVCVVWVNNASSGAEYGVIAASENSKSSAAYADVSGLGALHLGRGYAGAYMEGRIYGIVACCQSLDATQLATARKELAASIGVTL